MKTNGLTSRIISLIVTFIFLFTLVPTAVLANGTSTTDYTMSLLCDNETIKTGDTVTITVKLDGPMLNIGLVQYSVEFDDKYVSGIEGENVDFPFNPLSFDTDWYYNLFMRNELGSIATPSGNVYNDSFNVIFVGNNAQYITETALGRFADTTSTIAGKIKFKALQDIENPAEVFTLKNCLVEHIIVTVVEGKEEYNQVEKTVTAVQIPDKAVANVISLIDAIGTVEFTDACLGKIEQAETAYESLSDKQKANVTNYNVLTGARDKYDSLVAEGVDALIEAIGEVTLASEQAILTAQNAYNELSDNQKKHIKNKTLLDSAAETYATILEQAKAKAKNVDILIEKIGTVVFTEDSMKAIATARETYWTLSSDEKIFVTNLDALTGAEEEFVKLLRTEISDISEILSPIYEIGINRIKPNEYDTANTSYKTAQERYDSLYEMYCYTEANGNFPITRRIYELVMNQGDDLIEIKEALEDVKAEVDAIKAVEKLIEDIGNVAYTDDCRIAIENAEAAYEELKNNKVYVTNSPLLETARETYNRLEKEQIAIDAVIEAIEDIGEVTRDTYNDALQAIAYAEEEYNALDDTLKERVTNIDVLNAAKAERDSWTRILNVEELIDSIGEVTLDSLTAIMNAESAYNSEKLSDDERSEVQNADILQKARAKYNELKADMDKEEADRREAQVVINKIAELAEKEIDLSDDAYVTGLAQAEAAYAALTDDQKVYVDNYITLTEARATYNEIKNVYDKIASIGEVIYKDGNDKIVEAREAYNDLDDTLKEKVINYDVLVKAEKRYEDLGKINAVIVLIENIGDVTYTETCREAIETAEKAYAELDDMLKPEMADEYALLQTARKAYEALAPIVSQIEAIEDYDGSYVLVITNIEKGRKVTVNGTEANQIIAGDNVYYILASAEPFDDKDIKVYEAAQNEQSKIQYLGNINNDGEISVLDAQLALKKAALITDAVFESNPMAYVRADVNGNGTITARDAYLIAMAILDPTMADSFKVYSK